MNTENPQKRDVPMVTMQYRNEQMPTYVEGHVFEPGFYAEAQWRDDQGRRWTQPAPPGATWSEALANLAEQLKMKGR